MTYKDATDFLFNLQAFGIKLGLERMTAFLEAIGNPQQKLQSIHVAGTNGKGSTSAMMESILRQTGRRTGLFTSPHLVNVEERIKINGRDIDRDDFLRCVEFLEPFIKAHQTTFFESLTGIAFYYFAQKSVEIAVIEVGLGGRLDATNVIRPLLTLLTPISLDHQHVLGDSLEAIAGEKAGILKPGIDCLTINENPDVLAVFEAHCRRQKCRFFPLLNKAKISNVDQTAGQTIFDLEFEGQRLTDIQLSLNGTFQIKNATLAICAALKLAETGIPISHKQIRLGLKHVHWPGRMQLIKHNPRVLIDVGHNPDGMSMFVSSLPESYTFEKAICILGVVNNKDYDSMLQILSRLTDTIIVTEPDYKRALPVGVLATSARTYFKEVIAKPTVLRAFEYALKRVSDNDIICAIGSHFLIGELLHPENCLNFGLDYNRVDF